MKAYSIGRESGCDIVINDNTDIISRRHAILNVASSGKMTIVDQSHNGTYVNGIRISPNVPVPVTRKDNISFAHVAKLDWNRVPKSTSLTKYLIIAAIAVIVILGCVLGVKTFLKNRNADPEPPVEHTSPVPADSIKDETKDLSLSVESVEKDDSLKKKDDKQEDISEDKKEDKKEYKKETSTTKKSTQDVKKKAICPTCNKPVSECRYGGKHPEPTTTRGDR